MNSNYLILRADEDRVVRLVDSIQEPSMGAAIQTCRDRKEIIPNSDRWFVVHAYEVTDE